MRRFKGYLNIYSECSSYQTRNYDAEIYYKNQQSYYFGLSIKRHISFKALELSIWEVKELFQHYVLFMNNHTAPNNLDGHMNLGSIYKDLSTDG